MNRTRSNGPILPSAPARLRLLLLLLLPPCAGPASAGAQEPLTVPTPAPALCHSNGWDRLHARLSAAIANRVERVDRFFGDDRLIEDNRRTRLHAGLGLRHDREEGASLLTDVKLRLALPRMEDRLHVLLDDSFTADDTSDPSALPDAARKSKPETGLRYIFSDKERRTVSASGGMRLGSESQVFGRLRGRIVVPCGRWETRLGQNVAWFSRDGWAETSEMTWNRPLRQGFLFRSVSRLTWEESASGVTPSQSLFLFRELANCGGFRFEVSGIWPETPHTAEALYETVATYRRAVYRNWLFLEVAPGLSFRQTADYECNPFVTVRCEIVFSDD